MSKRLGKDCYVKLGTATVVGMGTWSMNGISQDDVDFTQFGDSFKQMESGLKDGGTVSFDGWYDADDATGAEALRYYQNAGTDITNLRLYIDNTSYFEPCRTTGYWSPTSTTGEDTQLSSVRVTSCPINTAVADNIKINFELKVDGVMVLV